jgi:hypothetical protein
MCPVQALRSQIPGLEENERAPTGVILTKAYEIIADLQATATTLEASLAAARTERVRLTSIDNREATEHVLNQNQFGQQQQLPQHAPGQQ